MGCKKKKFLLTVFIAVASVITLTSCGAKSEDNTQAIPSLPDSYAPLDEKYQNNPGLLEADIYANHYDISEEEALRRFDIMDAFSGLEEKLITKEAETFAGLWIQHEPSFRVVVAFTRDGEETIKQYVSENLSGYVEVRTVRVSYLDLLKAQEEVGAALRGLGIMFDSATYVQENRVEVRVVEADRLKINEAISSGKLNVPDYVDIVTVKGLATFLSFYSKNGLSRSAPLA